MQVATRTCQPRRAPSNHNAFTLVELLVVVAIVALLLALLAPALGRARRQARVVVAHADLRNICLALDAYALDYRDRLPPTRAGCGTDVQHQLPFELTTDRYLPPSSSRIPQAAFVDVFAPDGHTYKYRAPGAIWFNGGFFDDPDSSWRPRSKLWVPDDFPHCASDAGRFYADRSDEPPSPAVYAVWSIGPDPRSPKFPRHAGLDTIDDARFPLPKRFWLLSASDAGLITHYKCRKGFIHASP